jgi:hypothetical protein
MRVQREKDKDVSAKEFAEFLLRIGEGKETAVEEMEYCDFIIIPEEFAVECNEEEFVKLIFPNIHRLF